MNRFDDSKSLARIAQKTDLRSTQLAREMAKLTQGSAFEVSRAFAAETELRRALMATAVPPNYAWSGQLERAIAAMRHNPILETMRTHEAFIEPMTRLRLAMADLAETAGWSGAEEDESAETLGALADAADRDRVTLELQPSGDIVVDGTTVPAAEMKEAVTEAATAVESLAQDPATRQDLANLEKAVIAKLEHRKTGSWLTALMVVGHLVRDFSIEIGAQPLWEKFMSADEQTVAEKASGTPRLFTISGDGVSLREEDSLTAGIRLQLDRGDLVQLVEQRDTGWSLVRAQISGDSFEQGWVATIYLQPADGKTTT